jgi:two-component system chemotaxis response regulator CheY
MPKKVALVGHCGADSSYLRLAVSRAEPGVQIIMADDDAELKKALDQGTDLILFNRQLDYGFEETEGAALVGKLSRYYPNTRMMLVSNYPEAQAQAVAAGAMPGFGKRELGSPRVTQLIKDALADRVAESA